MLNNQGAYPPLSGGRFWIVPVEGLDRDSAFQLSQANFTSAFNAQIADDTEEFYSVIDRSGMQVAAFGLNRCTERMASGKYLHNQDICAAVYRRMPGLCGDERLVELCHLGLVNGRVFCQLLPHLASFLAQQADVLICTATSQLAKHFVQRGFASHRLAQACLSQLPDDEQDRWGSYYSTNPQVLVGELIQAERSRGVAYVA